MLITHLWSTSITTTLELYANRNHNILPILGLCELQTLLLVHDVIHNEKTHSNLVINTGNRSRSTRQVDSLAVVRAYTNQGQKQFSYIGPSKFNALPNELKGIINRSLFKLKIKLYLKRKINELII